MRDLIKQPNGKYCSVHYNGKIEFDNYTEQDVINMYIEQAKQAMNDAQPSGAIIERLLGADRYSSGVIGETRLAAMGFDRPYKELVKYIPREPINQQYAGRDFTMHGECPNCGNHVQDCMGRKPEKCDACGQLLKW